MAVIHTRLEAPPTPLTPLVALVAAAATVFGVGTLAGDAGDPVLTASISLALLGVVLAIRRWDERRSLCAEADTWIARHPAIAGTSHGWRIAELTSARERRRLGGSVRDIVGEISPQRLPGASPLNRVALRPHTAELAALADRLDDLDSPVAPAGILAVRRLLTEPGSALYARPLVDDRPCDVGAELAAVRASLEVMR
ncbi:MAG TPA: hypothetical protein VMB53_05660 [Gaiellaceae bacterium]|nr:hypothetical protein [Gaiellaceae bacterium]